MKKIAIITTHPIQYNAPLFKLLSEDSGMEIKVFYTWSQTETGAKYDPAFGKIIEWDIPLLEGYSFEFVENVAKKPGSHHFRGIDNPKLINRILKWDPNYLLVYGWNFKSHLKCLRYFKGKVPIIFRGDSTLLDESKGFRKLIRRIFLTWIYRNIDYALYVGKNNKDYYLAHGLKSDQLVFAPHAIDNQRFTDNTAIKEKEAKVFREKLDIGENDLVIMFAGKFEEKKDPQLLIRLANQVVDKRIKFLFVGNGTLEPELKIEASRDNRIIFLDFQNQNAMPVVYRMADILILPSIKNETWGLVINEAMACRRPVIVSDKVGCAPDIVLPEITGWIFVNDDTGIKKLKIILLNVLNDRDRLIKMGAIACEKIQDYSFSSILASIKSLVAIISKNK